MASVRFVCLWMLAAFPALAQIQSSINVYGTSSNPVFLSGAPAPHFELRAVPPSPTASISAGFASSSRSMTAPFSIGHRYFYNEAAHTYFGYDVVIQPEQQADTFRVNFYDLSIGPLDFQNASPDSLDPTQWKKLPLPALPAPKLMQASDTVITPVFVDPDTGQKLIDSMSIVPMPQLIRRLQSNAAVQQMQQQMQNLVMVRNGMVTSTRSAPTVSGTARDYSVDDAEMRIQQARVTVNGTPQQLAGGSRAASGTLVWFYLPKRGRYILSLAPRRELGFVKAGEIRGGVVTFKEGNDEIVLESPITIASGDAPYILYVLHDPEWEPTAQGQSGSLLLGSVSSREIAALTRK
jgi:hypothetical protein